MSDQPNLLHYVPSPSPFLSTLDLIPPTNWLIYNEATAFSDVCLHL